MSERHGTVGGGPSSVVPFVAAVVLIAIVGVWIRLDLLTAIQWRIDSDEAIVGLMAKHIVDGQEIPVFYYGQHYMGSLEPLCAAVAFAVFGISTVALKSIPLLFSLWLIVLVYQTAKEIGGRNAGLVAALLCAVPPAPLVEWSSKARGGFIEVVCISALALGVTIRAKRARLSSEGGRLLPSPWYSWWIGLVVGLGWWVNNQIIFAITAIGLVWAWMLLAEGASTILERAKASGRHLAAGLIGFFVGGMPFWIYNLNHQWASFGLFHATSNPWSNLAGLMSTGLPILLGAKRFWHTEDLFPWSTVLIAGVYGYVLVAFAVRRFRGTGKMLEGVGVELLFLGAAIGIFSVSSFGWLFMAPRYLLPMYPAIFVVVGVYIGAVAGRIEGVCLLVSFLSINLLSSFLGGRAVPGEPYVYEEERVAQNHEPLIRWLDERHIGWVKTNYWIGYRLAFETQERIRFVVFGEPHEARIKGYQTEGMMIPSEAIPFVLTPKQATLVEAGLRAQGASFERAIVGDYVVFYEVHPPLNSMSEIPHTSLVAAASHHTEVAQHLIDGSLETRWGSGAPQAPGMWVSLSAPPGHAIAGARIALGQWGATDFPRSLAAQCATASGERKQLFDDAQYRSIGYVSDRKTIEFRVAVAGCESLILTQGGSDTFFDWSIADISLFEEAR